MRNPIYLPTESALLHAGHLLAQTCHERGMWIYLWGNLGAGKTTLVRGFLQGLGYQGRVKSPTYTLVEPYVIHGQPIYHFDFYRISQQTELVHLGLEEYFTPKSICLVEWPDYFIPALPEPDLMIFLTPQDQGRGLRVESKTPRGAAIMEQFLHAD